MPTNSPITETPPPTDEADIAVQPGAGVLDKSNHRVREMFGQIAPRYDLMNHLLSVNIDKRWRRKTVDRLRFDNDSPVLDVCTGTGDLALEIRRRTNAGIAVIGSDFCLPMLQIAEKKARIAETQKLSFVEADAQQLPFPNDTFQVVTVAFGLRNVSDTDRGLQEMARVCQPGGQVAVLEFSKPTLPGLRGAYDFYFRHVLPRVGQYMARNDKSAYHYLPASVAQFPSGKALAERMEANGIQNVRMYPMTFGVATLYEGTI